MANYDIDIYGGKITVTADTTPTGHNIATKSIPGWCCGATDGSAWTCEVLPNSMADNRTGEITVQITTNESGDYDPTSISEDRTFSFIQAGTGTTPGKSIHFVFASTENFGEFTMAVSGDGVYDEQTTEGTSDTGDLGSSSIPAGASIKLGVKNGTSNTRQIAIDYTSSSPSYSFSDVSSNSWKWINVTQADGKTFYIQIEPSTN